jgi:thiosulfate/3-mercaptopyruvate sulfurtransferase
MKITGRKNTILAALWLSLVLSPWAIAQPAQWAPLLDVETLATLLDNASGDGGVKVRVLHVTGDSQAGGIPGSVYVPYAEFRGPSNNAGQLPAIDKLERLVQQLGIEANTPVVIVHQGSSASDFGAATRVYWTLKSLGVRYLSVLNGGFQQWLAAGLPVDHDVVSIDAAGFQASVIQASVIQASGFVANWNDSWQMTTVQVEQALNNSNISLIDSRPTNFFLGQQATAARPGTISGASNLSFDTWFDGAMLKPVDQLQHLLASSNQRLSPTTVSFCNTGHWASINWFVLSELIGVSNTRMYAESVVEWAQEPRPMDNQPGRLRWYSEMTRSWLRDVTGL